ncbi:MAG: DUF4124 domain-containing protein [Deltaproteobacteria bacterium]|nr:DUF4124 domain-containing protein [Deltaproteobacteria bacterium]MBW1956248.1 DUF4124 domain-containing protein [Deltaproteobacteria bacterium]
MRTKSMWILFFCAVLAAPAAAQFYKYTDSQGNVRFTDDLNQVPEAQRSGATPYEAVESRPDASPIPERPEDNEKRAEDAAGQQAALEQARQALEEKKKQLEAEYKALMEKRAALEAEKGKRKTRTQALEYNKAVMNLNDDIAAYEGRRKAFDAEVEAYNERLKADMKKRLEKMEASHTPAP